jgi:hypothetical protein
MSDDLVKRLRMVTGFIRFETGDRVAASACLSEEAACRIEKLEAKLEKAVEFIEDLTGCEWPYCEDAKRVLAELKGQDDE